MHRIYKLFAAKMRRLFTFFTAEKQVLTIYQTFPGNSKIGQTLHGLGNPSRRIVNLLAQEQIQLGGVVLNVAHIVQ